MNCEKIKQMIVLQLPAAQVSVESHDDIHFSATVVSDLFEGENLVKRQRRVYAALGDHIHNGDIHALTLKTLTPKERVI
jgi:acid stress-induced BolA-like protein IbaG/YrbA